MKEIREYVEEINRMNEIALNWQYVEGGNHEAEIEEMQKKNEEMFNELVSKYGMDMVLREIMS